MKRRGFTLIEILAVLAIISILMGMVMVVMGRSYRSAKKAVTMNAFGSILAACEQYKMFYGQVPPDQYTAGKEPADLATVAGQATESSAVLLWYLNGRYDVQGPVVLPDGQKVTALLDLPKQVKTTVDDVDYLVDAEGNEIRYDRDGGTGKPLLVSGSGDAEVRSE